MKEVTRFLADDLTSFDNKDDCLLYEWYSKHKIYINDQYIQWSELLNWICINREKLLEILNET